MKKIILPVLILTTIFASCVKDRSITAGTVNNGNVNTSSDSLITYWNFNTDSTSLLTPTYSKVTGATWSYSGAYFDTAQSGTGLNGIGADTIVTQTDASLRLRNPASGPFTLTLPTTGYKNIVLKYAEERTSKGAQSNTIMYSVDGTNFISTALSSQASTYTVDTNFAVVSFDFSSDSAVNNNPNFKVQISFSNGSANTTGNDRFDNITLYGVKQ